MNGGHDQIIAGWIGTDSRLLDLGCGDGDLLALLQDTRGVQGLGIEIDEQCVAVCVEKGLQTIQDDIESGLAMFADKSFDYVVLSRTLQEMVKPLDMIVEMLRVGSQAIISIDNAAYWRNRLAFLGGKLPRGIDTAGLSRLIAAGDFEMMCRQNRLAIRRRSYLGGSGQVGSSLLAQSAVYLLGGS